MLSSAAHRRSQHDSSPCRGTLAWLALACLVLASGCESGQIEISSNGATGAYARGELEAAISQYTSGDRAPLRYRDLAAQVATLAPRFDEEVAADAQRHLLFLAFAALDARFEDPVDSQMRDLALTDRKSVV